MASTLEHIGKGSSPRVRGTPQIHVCDGRRTGIIPACAGNTDTFDHVVEFVGDHPRVCGEHTACSCDMNVGEGSSPRVRGTLRAQILPRNADGIIPACAGNTFKLCNVPWDMGDHPRVCGEHHCFDPICGCE